ncbi:MAG: glycosyltransferase family 4 protein [Chitinophagales bacterium]|nr:glycosyltransferase family 4 protein [Chitinophagales bacterium]MDW8419612.1 glycosyltransferase family 4 protein [Chitinophagales bacterium]
MRILFLTPYPRDSAPSQRFRFEHYYPYLERKNIVYHIEPFLDQRAWDVLYQKGKWLQKGLAILRGFLRRAMCLFRLHHYDYVFIHREASPLGPPVFEWLIAKAFKKKYIYDFDDAIWLPNASDANRFISSLKWYHKTSSVCRWAHTVSAGNDFLAAYARRFNPQVTVIPTVVNTETVYKHLKNQRTDEIVIGWTGTHSTIRFLEPLIPMLLRLCRSLRAKLLVIADRRPDIEDENFEFVKWNKATEAEDVLRMNIGIMPLADDDWSRGKCGFKAIQYMALGIPAVASPVGVNTQIIDHGINGYLCRTEEEWEHAIRTLAGDASLREKAGIAAREKICAKYSVHAWADSFIALFTQAEKL